MTHRVLVPVICFVLAGFVPFESGAQDIPIPKEWDTYFVWFLVVNPEHQPASQDEERALTSAHIQYQLRLQEVDQSIVAGGLGEGADESIVGITILRADGLAEAQAIASADPAVRAGRLVSWVREWWVPTGRLPTAGCVCQDGSP